MRKVIHLLPYDGIGGAEAAARSMKEGAPSEVDFHLCYVFPEVRSQSERARTHNPWALLKAARGIAREAPDLLLVSLWRSAVVAILVRLMRPRTRMVLLIHNSVDAHLLDFLFTRWAMALSTAVWGDSEASMRMRFKRLPAGKVTTIPFLTRHLSPLRSSESAVPARPVFAFWGRVATQKNLPRALDLFHRIWQERPDARFIVIGPDGGELERVRAHCAALALADAVRFAGPLSFEGICEEVKEASFYLQTSDYEGMAMSVVESMQLGLVPVVTPVGEIGRYCRAGHNSVIVDEVDQAADEVLELLRRPDRYMALRDVAIRTWADKPLYRDAVLAECVRLLPA